MKRLVRFICFLFIISQIGCSECFGGKKQNRISTIGSMNKLITGEGRLARSRESGSERSKSMPQVVREENPFLLTKMVCMVAVPLTMSTVYSFEDCRQNKGVENCDINSYNSYLLKTLFLLFGAMYFDSSI